MSIEMSIKMSTKNVSQNVSREPSFRYTTILEKKTTRKCDIMDSHNKEMRYNKCYEHAGNPILGTQRYFRRKP